MLHDVLTFLGRAAAGPDASAGCSARPGSRGGAAIATVVQVHGSAPLPVGTVMAVRADGAVAGAVSGGCVEQQVIEVARAVAAGAPARRLRFAPSADPLLDSGLPCGGGIDVLVERWGPSAAQDAFARSVLRGAAATLRSEAPSAHGLVLHEAAARRRLVLVGAGLVATAVADLAGGLGWEPVVIDPREAFAARASSGSTVTRGDAGDPGERAAVPAAGGGRAQARVLGLWPAAALASLPPLGASDALLTLSHHPALDDEALQAALATEVGFVGALGSRRSHAERLERLRDCGVSERRLERVVGPVGLDLGGWTPREIALAIVAELVAVHHGRGGGRLTAGTGAIHGAAPSREEVDAT